MWGSDKGSYQGVEGVVKKILGHLKNFWPWLLGVLGGVVVWLKFIHDPRVAREAKRELKVKELDKRRKNLEEVEADTWDSEAKLNGKKRKLEEELDEKVSSDVGSTADRMASRFGWTDKDNGG